MDVVMTESAMAECRDVLDAQNVLPPNAICPGLLDLLLELRGNNIKTALCSDSKDAEKIVECVGIGSLFDVVIDGTILSHPKPDPQLFLLGAEFIGSRPSNCVVFAGSPSGIEAAAKGAMRSVGVGRSDYLADASLMIDSLDGFTLADLMTLER